MFFRNFAVTERQKNRPTAPDCSPTHFIIVSHPFPAHFLNEDLEKELGASAISGEKGNHPSEYTRVALIGSGGKNFSAHKTARLEDATFVAEK